MLTGTIVGPLARLQLVQRFRYSRAECQHVLEAVYRFPLPGDAAVTAVTVQFGAVVVRTRLAERTEAEREYAAARQDGRAAAAATRESADVFTLQIAGLQPDVEVVVETSFVLAAAAEGLGWQLRLPLTIGPRYSRDDESGFAASQGQPLQVWRDPAHRFGADLRVCSASGPIRSPSHPVTIEGGRVRLEDVVPDRDFVLTWEPERTLSRPALHVISHDDWSEGERYFLALITPPASGNGLSTVDREVLLLVDRSGSMAGPKWEASRWAVRRFLAGLHPTDRFNLGLFESHCAWLEPAAVPGTSANRERALAFVEAYPPQGGTELGVVLEQALGSERAPGEVARYVVIITDAQVSDEARILQLVETEAEHEDRRRVSVISIDSAPRSAFVRSLAEAAGGEAVFLTSDPQQEDITSALDRVLETWARPIAANLELLVETGNLRTTRSRITLGDMPVGRSLWVSGALSLFAEPVLKLRMQGQVVAEHDLTVDVPPGDWPEVRALFGARQVGRLERLESQALATGARDAILDELGYANHPLRTSITRPVYAENAPAAGSLVHQLLLCESLRFGLVCSATAFVGERVEAGQRVAARVQVPSALPAGWSESFVVQQTSRPALMAQPAVPAPPVPTAGSGTHFAPPRQPRRLPNLSVPHFLRRDGTAPKPPAPWVLRFKGVPRGAGGELVLVQGVGGQDVGERLSRLQVGVGDPTAIDDGTEIWVCVGEPQVRIKLRELLMLGGVRPLNIAVAHGASVRVILKVAAWAAGEVSVELA